MIAQHRNRSIPEARNKAHDIGGPWTAIYKVSGKPKLIVPRVEANSIEKLLQAVITTLYVPDRIERHKFDRRALRLFGHCA